MALAIGYSLHAPKASAQGLDPQWTYCVNQGDAYAPDLVIGGCTSVIQSGRETQANLSIAFNNRGFAYQHGPQPDYVRAIADTTQAIALNPQNADAFNNRGNAYNSGPQHDYARAIADYTQAIALNPQDADGFSGRGDAYFGQRDYTRALADFDQAIRLNPLLASALCHRGNAYYFRRDYARAIADYEAADRQWQDGFALFGRGVARLRLGQVTAGQADIATATARYPNSATEFAAFGVTP